MFFLLLVLFQLATYLAFWLVIVNANRLAPSATGAVIGLALGYIFISYVNQDPLLIILLSSVFSILLFFAQFLTTMRVVATLLIVFSFAFAIFQVKQYQVMPDSLAWVLDYGKAEPTNINKTAGKKIWGPAGLSEMYSSNSDERTAWLYTNGSSPSLVLTDKLINYDNAWWMGKAPLAMAIYDAVQPKSILDIGTVPSDMVWRAVGQRTRIIYGLYGSHDWTHLSVPGLELIRKSVVLPQKHFLSAEGKKIKTPVDMIVLSSGHEGKEGWISSNGGEQVFFDPENILSYWAELDEDGVLVLLSRNQSVFVRQILSVWAALKDAGMSDDEFLDRAWGLAPVEEAMTVSPYRYSLVLTRKARDKEFAQAMRGQVLALPVRYLFGYGLPPSQPYNMFYQNERDKVQAIFTGALSSVYRKNMTLETSDSRKSIPYQFVNDVYPQYKNMLVLSVGGLIGIILFPLQKFRRIENLQILQGPSVAVWLTTGGAIGILIILALAFLVVYPSRVIQEFRLLYLLILLSGIVLIRLYKESTTNSRRMTFAAAAVLVLISLLQIGDNKLHIAGILFLLMGVSLPAMRPSLMRDAEAGLISWWWFAMAAGSAVALFWSMRLYSVFGNGLLMGAGLLLICVAGVFWWHGRSTYAGETHQRGVARDNLVA